MKPDVRVDMRRAPFLHSSAVGAIDVALAEAVHSWMENEAPWRLRIADFYEQWEIHLEGSVVPEALSGLVAPAFVRGLADTMFGETVGRDLRLLEVTAHKLLEGQTIKIHNDNLDGAETHRILIQLNGGWRDEQGGMLMLFGSDNSADVRRIVRPLHRSAFGFVISDNSFHAVSTVTEGRRYTLVYSFLMGLAARA